jgi:Na+/proline symporter
MSVSWLESSTGAACVAAGATAAALALVLAVPTLARRFSRVTRRAAQDDERVLVRCGGLALACGVAAASAFAGEPRFALAPWLTERAGRPVELAPLGAIVAALALGALDDLQIGRAHV